uniref:Transposase n=1 Tax=Ditylenchus dipsaci TaxID=166011 RepID=A0A915D4M5_9BILA
MQNNSALNRLLAISKVQRGAIADLNMPPNQIASIKYAPMVSCDVERSFSVYKNILAENRTNFTPENLEMYIICNCESYFWGYWRGSQIHMILVDDGVPFQANLCESVANYMLFLTNGSKNLCAAVSPILVPYVVFNCPPKCVLLALKLCG